MSGYTSSFFTIKKSTCGIFWQVFCKWKNTAHKIKRFSFEIHIHSLLHNSQSYKPNTMDINPFDNRVMVAEPALNGPSNCNETFRDWGLWCNIDPKAMMSWWRHHRSHDVILKVFYVKCLKIYINSAKRDRRFLFAGLGRGKLGLHIFFV